MSRPEATCLPATKALWSELYVRGGCPGVRCYSLPARWLGGGGGSVLGYTKGKGGGNCKTLQNVFGLL